MNETDLRSRTDGSVADQGSDTATHALAKRLRANFERDLAELFAKAAPGSLLDVGCGEGERAHKWAKQLGSKRVVGIDLDDPYLQTLWRARSAPNLEYKVLKTEDMPFAEREFEVVTAIDVLEHVPDPRHVIEEMARVSSKYLLVSVPREPLWRAWNVARGAYISDLGNSPGHLNHWSRRAFVSELSEFGAVEEARSPFPWTVLLVRLRQREAGRDSGGGDRKGSEVEVRRPSAESAVVVRIFEAHGATERDAASWLNTWSPYLEARPADLLSDSPELVAAAANRLFRWAA